MFQTLDKAGVVPLAWGENGYREITNSKHAIKTPADLKGMKIRVVGSPLFLDTFTALGANPTQMSWADAQPALASGAVDGQENPLFRSHGAQDAHRGQKYVTTWGYITDPLIFVVNKDIWNSWTPADREIVRRPPSTPARRRSRLRARAWSKPTSRCSRTSPAMGVTVTQLSPAEREAFVKATRPVYEKWKGHDRRRPGDPGRKVDRRAQALSAPGDGLVQAPHRGAFFMPAPGVCRARAACHMPSERSSASVSLAGGAGAGAAASRCACAISASGSGASCGSKS